MASFGHIGSWGLPDFNLTEGAAKILSGGNTTDLTSALKGNYSVPTQNAGNGNPNTTTTARKEVIPANTTNLSYGGGGGGGGTTTGVTPTMQDGGWYNGQYYKDGKLWSSRDAYENQGSGGGGFSEPSVDWDSLYAPMLSALTDAENTARKSAGLAEQNVLTGKNTQLSRVETEEQLANERFEGLHDKAGRNRQTALDEAVRGYNALRQKQMARFGGGSSAGQAIGEIAQRGYFENQGKIEQSYADIFGEIAGHVKSTMMTFANTKKEIEGWAETEKRKIEMQLNEQLQGINMARAQTQADKSAKIIQVIDRATQYARQVRDAQRQREEALSDWFTQQNYLVQNSLVPTYRNYNPQTVGYMPQQASFQNISNANGGTPSTRLIYNTQTGRYEPEEDEKNISYLA